MNTINGAAASDLPPRFAQVSRAHFLLALVPIFAGLSAAAAWLNSEKFAEASPAREAAPLLESVRAMLSQIQSEQQKLNDEIAELGREIGAQQAGLERISDQLAA
ncbi:septal ring factor EnvC (AmiA/AmiB activator) [Bradyrhizobium sp. LB7.1]